MEFRDLLEELRAQGWRIERTSKGHWQFFPPDRTKTPVVFSGTPSDWRSLHNCMSKLERSGFRNPWKPEKKREGRS